MKVTILDEVFTGSWHPWIKLSSASFVYTSMRQSSAKANDTTTHYDENRMAGEIVSVLPAGVVRECSPEKQTIRYSLRAAGLKLRTIVFSRKSLRKLIQDPLRAVKVEYLQRDLLQSATRRSEFRYPRVHIHFRPSLPVALPQVSMA
jgi:hypothetical protein